MSKGLVAAVVAVVVIAAGILVYVNQTEESAPVPSETSVSAPVPAPKSEPAAVPEPVQAEPAAEPAVPAEPVAEPVAPTEPVAEPVASPDPVAAATEPAGPALDEKTIVGTEWQVGMVKLAFKEGGVAETTVGTNTGQGTWTIEGDTLTVSSGGQSVSAKLVGDKIMAGKNAIPRIK